MKRLRTMLTGAAMAALSLGTAQSAELIYSSHTPDVHSDNSYSAKRFFDRITAATGGEQTFKIMGGGVLAAGAKAMGAVKTGAVDTAILIYNYMPSDLPVLTLLGDLYSSNTMVAAAATTETLLLDCPQCMDEMKKQNIVVLYNTATSPYNFLCGSVKIAAPDDVKGKKLRGTGSMAQLAAALGGTPVNITFAEVYEALQRGQIDCTMMDAGNLQGAKLEEVVKYVTDLSMGVFQSIGFIAVNRGTWDGFTDAQRKAWLDSAAQGVADYEVATYKRIAEATASAKAKGVEWVEASPELTKAVDEIRNTEVQKLVATAKERGVADPQAVVDAFNENTAKWTRIVAEIGEGTDWSEDQWAKYAAAVKSEIYDNFKGF